MKKVISKDEWENVETSLTDHQTCKKRKKRKKALRKIGPFHTLKKIAIELKWFGPIAERGVFEASPSNENYCSYHTKSPNQ